MAIITINTRKYFVNCNSISIAPVSNGRWEVTYDRDLDADGEVINEGRKFIVIGGRKAGGAAHEWWVHHPEFYGDTWLPTSSMIAAVRTGVAY